MSSASTTWHAVKVASNFVVAKDTATLAWVHHTRNMVLQFEHVLFQNARQAYQRVHSDMQYSRTPRDCMPESASRVTTSSHQHENIKVYQYVVCRNVGRFNAERVASGIAKLKSARKNVSQKRMDRWAFFTLRPAGTEYRTAFVYDVRSRTRSFFWDC